MTIDVQYHTIDQYDNETFAEISFETEAQAEAYIKECGEELQELGYVWNDEDEAWNLEQDIVEVFVVTEAGGL